MPPTQNTTPAVEVRRIIRCARKASLATLDSSTHHPYASLVALATEPSGAPVLLLSRLAVHTRNLGADSRASLLIEGSNNIEDPLAGGRVTLIGRVEPTESQAARRRFLAVHPSAAKYADFGDFRFFTLKLEHAHYVGGFGRICSLKPEDVLIDVSAAGELIAAEPEIIAALNHNLAEDVARLGARLSGKEGPWRVSDLDPGGMDLALGLERIRWDFEGEVRDLASAKEALRTALATLR